MEKFEGQPRNPAQPEELHFTSRHTAEFEGKVYDVLKIIKIAQELPITEIPVAELEKMNEGKYWHGKNGEWLGPEDILDLYDKAEGNWNAMLLKNPNAVDHIMGVKEADYHKHPLILVGPEANSWVIDGMHRLTRALIDRVSTIKARRLEKLPEEAVISENE